MGNADLQVGVQRGDGLVARFGAAVVVVGTTDAQTDPFASALLSALEQRPVEPGSPTASFAWGVADLLAAHRRQAPAFGLVVAVDEGFLLLLHGDVRAVVNSAGTTIELTGHSAGTWVDRLVSAPVQQISITLTDGPMLVDPRSDLRAGLVGGGGLVLVPRGAVPATAPAPAPPTATAPTAAPPTGPQHTVDRPAPPSARHSSHQIAPAQMAPAPPAPFPRTPERVGRVVEETAIVKTTTSALVADDGTRIPLDRHYVFGRDPSHDEAVLRGAASPIVVRDPDQVVSRVQVHVRVEGDAVTLRDSGSSNGTYIAAPGAAGWDRLTNRPTALPRGWSMRIGRRVYTYTPEQSTRS